MDFGKFDFGEFRSTDSYVRYLVEIERMEYFDCEICGESANVFPHKQTWNGERIVWFCSNKCRDEYEVEEIK